MKHAGPGTFWRWSLLAAGILLFGAVAITHARACAGLLFWQHAAEPLVYFVGSGAVAVGLLAVGGSWMWQAVHPRPKTQPRRELGRSD